MQRHWYTGLKWKCKNNTNLLLNEARIFNCPSIGEQFLLLAKSWKTSFSKQLFNSILSQTSRNYFACEKRVSKGCAEVPMSVWKSRFNFLGVLRARACGRIFHAQLSATCVSFVEYKCGSVHNADSPETLFVLYSLRVYRGWNRSTYKKRTQWHPAAGKRTLPSDERYRQPLTRRRIKLIKRAPFCCTQNTFVGLG